MFVIAKVTAKLTRKQTMSIARLVLTLMRCAVFPEAFAADPGLGDVPVRPLSDPYPYSGTCLCPQRTHLSRSSSFSVPQRTQCHMWDTSTDEI